MADLQKSYQSHVQYFIDHADLFRQLQEQLAKDLNADFSAFNEIPVLLLGLEDWVKQQLAINPSQVNATLYRVDVNQNKLEAEMQSGHWKSDTSLFAASILTREMQKVILRNQFSGKL